MSDIPDFADQCFFGSVNFVSHKPFIVLVSFIYISSLIALNCSFQDVHVLTIFRPHLIAIVMYMRHTKFTNRTNTAILYKKN